ncbi:MAG: hypothetical protein SPL46_02595, partial [Selenomonadaceae bacterium]|nr:hypothetical protein [Selenomonadaceae bacterium]
LLQGRAHNVHKVDVCALSLLCKSPRAQAAGAARLAGFTARAGAQCPQSGRLCVEFPISIGSIAEVMLFSCLGKSLDWYDIQFIATAQIASS